MDFLPTDFLALAALALLLGLKHGFDADHLATIDGMTRLSARQRRGFQSFCGVLFSLGHGAVVVAIALAASRLARGWQVPEWFETTGAVISIVFLSGLGLLNLHAVWRAAPDEMVSPVGLKGRFVSGLLLRLAGSGEGNGRFGPWLVMGVGALFALSFDTLSQAALFSVAGSRLGGWGHALALALLFTAGMLITDGINGLWISRLIRRADRAARLASRVMGLAVACVSLTVAAFGAARFCSDEVAAWSDGKELFFGAALVLMIGLSFIAGLRLARPPLLAGEDAQGA